MSDASSRPNSAVNRPMVGLISAGCISTGVYMLLRYPNAEGDLEMWQAGFIRSGVLMFAIWLALPTKKREAAWANISPWKFAGFLLVAGGIAVRPRILLYLSPVLAALGAFTLFMRKLQGDRDNRPKREWDRK